MIIVDALVQYSKKISITSNVKRKEMMNMVYQNNWPMTDQQYVNQDYVSYSNFDVFPGPNNFYMDQTQQQVPPSSHQPQFSIQLSGLNQQNSQTTFYTGFQRPVQLTTSLCRKGRAPASESMKRQRQLRRNERERERQARLNSAFDVLRSSIPSFLAPYKEEQKLTQIETLRLAKYYISSLKDMLDDCDEDIEESGEEDKSKKPRTESSSSSDGSLC